MTPFNLSDFEAEARRKLPRQNYDYIAAGADDEVTLNENRGAFRRLCLLPRVLAGGGEVETSLDLFGERLALPVALAPTAFHALAHPEAELATARGAARAGTIFTVSTLASRRLEAVASAAPEAPRWFQLYCSRDRGVTRSLVERAAAAGYRALILTVDVPVVGRREADLRNGFHLPDDALPENLLDHAELGSYASASAGSALADMVESLLDPALTWRDVDWLRGLTDLPLLLKGVLSADDARRAIEHGADGLVISNHGGRQLDSVPASIEVLPEIAAAVEGQVPLLIDGGVRRGTDVVKALALGARAVLIGRPYVWGLAAGGQAGVESVLALLGEEIRTALALLGCARIDDLGPEHVRWRRLPFA